MSAHDIGYAHHSGRFDRSPDDLAAALVELAQTPGVHIIACTEMANPARARAAKRALNAIGWALARVGEHGEEALAFDLAWFVAERVVEPQLSEVKTYSTTGRERAPFTALFVLLRDITTDLTYLCSVGHTPSHVGTIRGWFHNGRARQYRDGMPNWNGWLRHYTRLWKPTGGRVLSLDTNLDVAQRWVRLFLRACFPGLRLVHDQEYVDTHDTRTIDAILVGRRLTPRRWWRGQRIRVVRAGDSDHRTIRARLTATTRRITHRGASR